VKSQTQVKTDIIDDFERRHELAGLRLIQQIAQLTSNGHRTTAFLPEVLSLLMPAFAIDGCGIFQTSAPNSPFELSAHRGIPPELCCQLQKVPAGQGLIHQVFTTGIPHNWVDLRAAGELYCRAVIEAGWRSLLALPLTASGRTLGVMIFFQCLPRQFSRTEIDLLEQISLFVASGIDTCELLEKLEWQHRLTEASQRELERSRRQLREHVERLEVANQTLEQLGQMKDRFLALASHELRTPLTCILSAGQLLENHLQDSPPDTRSLLATMLHGGERLNLLVESLLEMARIESRDFYLARENIDLVQLLDSLLQSKAEQACARGIELRRGTVPDLFSPCGDRHHLERALAKILDNALKYTPPGGWIQIDAQYLCQSEIRTMRPQLEVFCPGFFTSENIPDMLDIRIIDSGTGIEEAERLHIFEKFHAGGDISLHGHDPHLGATPSAGLGLSLAKGLIEAHGGLLWSENRPDGPGSIFHAMLALYKRRKNIATKP
jgi:signal transduction histidine kinase